MEEMAVFLIMRIRELEKANQTVVLAVKEEILLFKRINLFMTFHILEEEQLRVMMVVVVVLEVRMGKMEEKQQSEFLLGHLFMKFKYIKMKKQWKRYKRRIL
jgi:hypothetical protein